jgi:FHA domain
MSHVKKLLISLLVAITALSFFLTEISPVLAEDNPIPPESPDEAWQPPDEAGQSVEPSVPAEPYSQPSSGQSSSSLYTAPLILEPGGSGSIVNAYLVNSYGQVVSNLYGNQAIYLIVSFNGPGYFYLWEYYPYGTYPYGHWLCYRWYRPYAGTWRIGPFVAQPSDPAGRYTWRMWFLSNSYWSTRSLSFNYIRSYYYPPDIPGTIPGTVPAPVYNPASISSFSASKSAIEVGETVVLIWTTTNATGVTISPSVGAVAASGSTTVTPSATTTYTLQATGKSGNSVSSTATVTVRQRVLPTIAISQPTIKSGQSASLSWNAPGAVSVLITGVGSASSSGTAQISPEQTTTYTLTAYYIDRTSQSTSVTVNVEQPPYLLWGLIALLAIAVIAIAVLLARRPARARKMQAVETQPRHITQTGDTDIEDTEVATTPVVEAPAAKLSLPDGNDILLAGNARSFGRRDFEEFMPSSQVSYISRQHINIWSEKGNYYIEDRSSTNGTRVNGMDIKGTGRHVLSDGDVIELAGKFSFNFQKQNTNN